MRKKEKTKGEGTRRETREVRKKEKRCGMRKEKERE